MRWIPALTFAALVTLSLSAFAGPPDRTERKVPQVLGADIETIGHCVNAIREASHNERFDAYRKENGAIRVVTGTEDDVRRFTACLREDDPALALATAPSVSPVPRTHSRHRDAPQDPAASTSPSRRP